LVPSGAPGTGFGGAAHSSPRYFLLVGSAILMGLGLATGFLLRRRRNRPVPITDDGA
jgi:hypothetical protein